MRKTKNVSIQEKQCIDLGTLNMCPTYSVDFSKLEEQVEEQMNFRNKVIVRSSQTLQ